MRWLERQWQSRTAGAFLLTPLAAAFGIATGLRRRLYRAGLFSIARPPVPVVVVGNIMAGGTGKTPLVIWLCEWLRTQHYRPGIVTRGYGGKTRNASPVYPDSDPAGCGDEAVLLAARTHCPVWSGRRRGEAVLALLAAHPECDIVVSDDGLQHYGLARDVEIAVVDGARGHGNGWLLPAGPLREMPSRLRRVDAVVVNGAWAAGRDAGAPTFAMRLTGRSFYKLLDPQCREGPEFFGHKTVHAIAGIGHPERFFRYLQELGLTVSAHAFPDHHAFVPADLEYRGAEAIVMTEKDAVKCRGFATESCWVLPVDADVDPALGTLLMRKLEKR